MYVKCMYCGNEVEAWRETCPGCGARLPAPTDAAAPAMSDTTRRLLTALVLLVFVAVTAFFFRLISRELVSNPVPAAPTTRSSFEELMAFSPADVFPPGSVHTALVEAVFDKEISRVTWEEIGRIKYLRPSGSNDFRYSFYNTWDFADELDFQRTVRSLSLPGDSVSYNSGELGYFVGLEELSVYGAARRVYGYELASIPNLKSLETAVATNYEELRDLTSLERLTIRTTNGGSLAYLDHLQALTYLSLDHADYSSLQALTNLPNLKTLVLGGNKYEWDVASIAQMPALEELELEGGGLKTLSPLGGLKSLRRLTVNGGAMRELRFVGELPALEELHLYDLDYLTGLDYLEGLPLTALSFEAAGLESIDFLPSLVKLEALSVSGAEDLSPLNSMPWLQHLSLRSSDCGATFHYGNLPELRSLRLESSVLYTGEGSIAAIGELEKLRSIAVELVHFDFNGDALFSPPNLKALSLRDCSIHFSVDCFSRPVQLERLTLSKMDGVGEAAVYFAEMPQLQYLDLSSTGLEDLAFLRLTPNLIYLDIRSNQLRDLLALENLPKLETALVGGNPLLSRETIVRLSPDVNIIE